MAKTPALTIPSSKVDIALTAGNTTAAMKAAGAANGKLYNIPIDKIRLIEGYNVRVATPDYIAHRDMLADLISENGFDATKPLAGYVGKDGDEDVIYLVDGHTRLDAVTVLNALPDADAIDKLPVVIHANDKTVEQLNAALVTSNNGRALTPFEIGVVVKRLLRNADLDKGAVASMLGITPRYVDDVLLLVNAKKPVREAVLNGQVSSTLAIAELRRDPEEAAERITAAVEKSDGKKVTKKNVGVPMKKVKMAVSIATGTDMKDIVKAVAAHVRSAILTTAGEDDAKLAAHDGTVNLVIEVPAPEKKPKAKDVKAAKTAELAEAAKAAKKTGTKSSVKKPTAKAEGGEPVEPAEPAAKAKPTAKTPRAKKPAAAKKPVETADDAPVAGAEPIVDEDVDGEEAMTPPAVKNGDGVNDSDVDI